MGGRIFVYLLLVTMVLQVGCTPAVGDGTASRVPLQMTAAPLRTLEPTPAAATPTETQAATAVIIEPAAATATQPIMRTAVPREDKTGIPAVDAVIEAMLSNNLEQRLALVRFVTSGCTTVMGLGGPPKCTEGQEEGTLVTYLPLGAVEGHHVLAKEVASVLDFEVEALYAAYRVADDLPDEPEYPRGAYVLFVTTPGGDGGSVTKVVRVDDAGAIVRLDGIGIMPVDLYFQQMAADLMDPPPESPVFSSEAAEILLYPPQTQPATEETSAGKPTPTPYTAVNDGQTAGQAAVPSPTAVVPPPPAELPRSLIFLPTEPGTSSTFGKPQGVWRLDPGATVVERLTPAELDITAFDIWYGDGRITYGTSSGQIYMVLAGGQEQLLYDAALETGNGMEIGSLAWSPEGDRLAFTMNIPLDGQKGEADGLWLLDQNDGVPVKLLDNRHLGPELSDVTEVRKILDADWSPDGSALLLRVAFWEHQDMLWLKPIIPDPNENNLYDLLASYNDGSWAADSQSILLSGLTHGTSSNLDRLIIETESVEQLIDGGIAELAILKAQELPAGIAFVARTISLAEQTQSYRLYLGQQLADGFQYAPAGPNHDLCSAGIVWDISWDAEGQAAAVSCDRAVQLISLDGSIDLDLTPYLGPMAGESFLRVFWEGGNN